MLRVPLSILRFCACDGEPAARLKARTLGKTVDVDRVMNGLGTRLHLRISALPAWQLRTEKEDRREDGMRLQAGKPGLWASTGRFLERTKLKFCKGLQRSQP